MKTIYITILLLLPFQFLFSQKINRLNKNGQRTGKWVVYIDSAKGIKSFEGRFRNGNTVGKAYYYSLDGVMARKEITRFNRMKTTFYYPDGAIQMKGKAKLENLPDKIHYYFYGKWNYYDERGKIVKYRYYKNGRAIKTVYASSGFTNDSLISFLTALELDFDLKNKSLKDSLRKYAYYPETMDKIQTTWFESDSLILKKLDWFFINYGYPTKETTGEASNVPFYILSFAPANIKEKYLNLLLNAAANGEVEMKTLAFYIDKIRVAKKLEQVYGTQYYITKQKKQVYYPSEDPVNLNKRRATAGLEPID